MKSIMVRLAELLIAIESRFPSIEKYCEKYLASGEPELSVSVTDEKIAAEKALSEEEFSDEYIERICIYREIAERLPSLSRFVFHGAAVSYKGSAYIFTAPSGTGKSTHIKLWRQHIGGEVDIINGDKPILKAEENGVTVYSSPWAGKERWNKNVSAPLYAICVIKRGTQNRIKKLPSGTAIAHLIKQIYLPKTREAKLQTLTLLDLVLKNVPVYLLQCDMSYEAVKTSFEAMTGEEMKQTQ